MRLREYLCSTFKIQKWLHTCRRFKLGNKQLADSFKVLEQRQKSLDMRPASLQLAGGKNNRSMDELTSGGNEGSDSKEEEAPAIIVFIIGGMTYSEIR